MRSLILFLYTSLSVSWAYAQLPSQASGSDRQQYNYTLRHYTVADGLPSRRITTLAQDDQGFIWMASPMGLVRYDGYRFTTHNRSDGLTADAVSSVLRDADGMLWIQYEDGAVDIMDPMRRTAIPFKQYFQEGTGEMIHAPIDGMAASAAGTVVFGQAGALVRYRGASSGFERKGVHCNGPLRPRIVEENDDVWCECASGFVHTSTQELLYLAADPWVTEGSNPARWEGISMTSARGLDLSEMRPTVAQGAYVTVQRSGRSLSAWVHPDGTQVLHDRSFNFPETHIRYNHRTPLTPDLWLVDGKIRRMRAGDVPYDAPVLFDLTVEDVDLEKETGSVLRDRAGNIWITNDHGLFKLTMEVNHFRRYLYDPHLQGSHGIRIRGMVAIAGRLHVNTEVDGYFKLDARSGDVLHRDTYKAYRLVVVPDGRGGLWRAVYGELFHEDQRGEIDGAIKAPDWASSIWSALILKNGSVLMGCENGLRIGDAQDSARTVVQPDHPELKNAFVWHLGRDNAGNILACTSLGVYELNENGIVLQRWWSGADPVNDALHYLPASDIRHFHEDPTGVFWLSTATTGLLHWDRDRGAVRTINHRQGLPVTSIHAAYPDESGSLWMPSDKGLIHYVPNSGQVKVFTTADGIAHHEFNRISHHRSADGHFYFGGINGITVFHPDAFRAPTRVAQTPIVLLAVNLHHADSARPRDHTFEIINGKPVVMRPTDRFFTVDMALLSYDDPKEIRYAWRIDGINSDWNFQQEPYLRFTALPYGDHILRIKALDREGRWSANELELAISMIRPLYLRWWFILACMLVLVAAAYALFQYRISQLRKVIRVRDRIALDLHDEVGSNLSSIVLFSTAVGTSADALPPKAAGMLKRITENSTRAMESMNDIVWSVNSGNDQIEDLTDRMRAFAQPLCEAAGVELDFTIGKGLRTRKLGMEERKSLYLVFKEALNNAVKHAHCSRIDVSLTLADGRFLLVVSDNGIGIAEDHPGSAGLGGNGLGNMRRRAVEVGGTMEVGEAPEGGTRVMFSVSSKVG